jgi:hypothetical protein
MIGLKSPEIAPRRQKKLKIPDGPCFRATHGVTPTIQSEDSKRWHSADGLMRDR